MLLKFNFRNKYFFFLKEEIKKEEIGKSIIHVTNTIFIQTKKV